MTRIDFYQTHLDRVSRSFAFCIEQLEQPLREWVALSYILCRLVDTIEDSAWPTRTAQAHAFDKFAKFIDQRPSEHDVLMWGSAFPAALPDSEKLLLESASSFFADLHNLSVHVRSSLQKTIRHMTKGMAHFSLRPQHLRLQTETETNQYCFFVAGIIGELLTQLALFIDESFPTRSAKQACHFGLFLQKINILKDQQTDETEGRFLLPARDNTRSSLNSNAQQAFLYLKAIPLKLKGYRLFCAWSLFLGLASLPWIDRNWESKKAEKISREETWTLLGEVHSQIANNKGLEEILHRFLPLVSPVPPPQEPLSAWFYEIYDGPLTAIDLEELGLGVSSHS